MEKTRRLAGCSRPTASKRLATIEREEDRSLFGGTLKAACHNDRRTSPRVKEQASQGCALLVCLATRHDTPNTIYFDPASDPIQPGPFLRPYVAREPEAPRRLK